MREPWLRARVRAGGAPGEGSRSFQPFANRGRGGVRRHPQPHSHAGDGWGALGQDGGQPAGSGLAQPGAAADGDAAARLSGAGSPVLQAAAHGGVEPAPAGDQPQRWREQPLRPHGQRPRRGQALLQGQAPGSQRGAGGC